MSRRLVITADDGFYAERRDVGIVKCLSANRVTEVSVLMNGLVARELLECQQQRDASCLYTFLSERNIAPGLHLNLTEGLPLTSKQFTSSLVNENGCFLGKSGFRERLPGMHLQQVELEIENQLLRFRSLFGVTPSHVDGHQHIHVLPELVPVLCHVLPRHSVLFVRIPEEKEDNFKSINTLLAEEELEFYRKVSSQASVARKEFTSCGLRSTDAFLGMTLMGQRMQRDRLVDCLNRTEPQHSIELMTHPGFQLETRSKGGCGPEGPDQFSQSADRQWEMEFLLSGTFEEIIPSADLKCVRFVDLLH